MCENRVNYIIAALFYDTRDHENDDLFAINGYVDTIFEAPYE